MNCNKNELLCILLLNKLCSIIFLVQIYSLVTQLEDSSNSLRETFFKDLIFSLIRVWHVNRS